MPATHVTRTPESIAPTVDAPVTARLLLAAAVSNDQPGTVVLALDVDRRLIAAISIAGATQPDSVHDVVELVLHCAESSPALSALVVESNRAGQPADSSDIDRWYALADECERAGIELIEWFIDDDGHAVAMRDATGGLPLW